MYSTNKNLKYIICIINLTNYNKRTINDLKLEKFAKLITHVKSNKLITLFFCNIFKLMFISQTIKKYDPDD